MAKSWKNRDSRFTVAMLILGKDKNGYPRTQADVARMLGLSRSSVSGCVTRLVRDGIIKKKVSKKRCPIYVKGPMYSIAENDIEWEAHRWDTIVHNNKGAVTEDGVKPDDGPLYSVHISGSWLMFDVEKEGELYRIPIDNGIVHTLFRESDRNTRMRGSENWNGSVTIGQDAWSRFRIRYQRSRDTRVFYISPMFEITVSCEQARNDASVNMILRQCFPLLSWLEKRGGWQFGKDDTGNYRLRKKPNVSLVHYAARGPLNDAVTDITGPFGTSGDGIWVDQSKGYAELETNRQSYIKSIEDLPAMHDAVILMSQIVKGHDDLIRMLNKRIENVEIQTVTEYKPQESTKNPPRGYQ